MTSEQFTTEMMCSTLAKLQGVASHDYRKAEAVALGDFALLRPRRSSAAVDMCHGAILALDLHRNLTGIGSVGAR
jgi:hypothetical protein